MSSMNRLNRCLPTMVVFVFWTAGVLSGPAEAQDRPDIVWQAEVLEQSMSALDISPDSTILATGSVRRTKVVLLRVSDGSLIRKLRADRTESFVASVAFSPDGALLASGYLDGTINLWRVSDGALLRTIPSGSYHFSFSPDGTMLVSPGRDDTVKFWRVSDGSLVRTLDTGPVRDIAWSPDGELLAGSSGSEIHIWRVSDGARIHTLTGHAGTVRDIAFSPDGTILGSGANDRTVKLWRVSDGSLIRTLTGHTWEVSCIDFSPDGERLISGSNLFPQIILWGISDDAPLRSYNGRKSARSVRFSPDGAVFGYGMDNGSVAVARNPFSGLCGPDALLSAKCKSGGTKVVTVLKKAYRDTVVTFTLDGENPIEQTTNRKGKTKVKYKGQPAGPHTVNVCTLEAGC